jgi:hypothetical protein
MFTNPLFGGGIASATLRANNLPSNQNIQILANPTNAVRLNPNNGANGGGFQLANSSGLFAQNGTYKFRVITYHSLPTSTNSGEFGLQQGFVSSGASGAFQDGGGGSLDGTASQALFTITADSGAQFPNANQLVTAILPSGGVGGSGDSFRWYGLGDVSVLTPFDFKIEIISRP